MSQHSSDQHLPSPRKDHSLQGQLCSHHIQKGSCYRIYNLEAKTANLTICEASDNCCLEILVNRRETLKETDRPQSIHEFKNQQSIELACFAYSQMAMVAAKLLSTASKALHPAYDLLL